MCLSGYVLARRGVLDKSTQRVGHIFYLPSYPSHSIILQQLNSLNVNFFTPCLLFSKVAFFLSPGPPSITIHLPDSLRLIPEKLRELWIIPIFFLLVTGTSLGVAWLLGNLFRLKPSQRYPPFFIIIWQTEISRIYQKLCDGSRDVHELKFASGRPFAIPRCHGPRSQVGRRRHKGCHHRPCSHLLAPL